MFIKSVLMILGLTLAAPAYSAQLRCKEIPASGKKSRGEAVIYIEIVHHKGAKKSADVSIVATSLWKKDSKFGKARNCDVSFDSREQINCVDDNDNGTTYDIDMSYDLFEGTDQAGAAHFDWTTDTGTPSEDNPGDIGRRFDMTCSY